MIELFFIGIVSSLIAYNIFREWCYRVLKRKENGLISKNLEIEKENARFYHENTYLQKKCKDTEIFFQEKIQLLKDTQVQLEKKLQSMCQEALIGSQKSFISLVEPFISRMQDTASVQLKEQKASLELLTKPLSKSLEQLDEQVRHLESKRCGAYESLIQQLKEVINGQTGLQKETHKLSTALRTPHIRGCWGEMQLKRVVELSGMLPYCDFQEQATLKNEEGYVRPDLIVMLPGERHLIVDAKTPITYYLEAFSAKTEQEHKQKLQEHARTIVSHIKLLSEKKYWSYGKSSPEFVLLFLPGESFLSAALEMNPALIEFAAEKQIVLATPTILIALLKTIAYGWRQEKLNEHAYLISELGKELYAYLEEMSTNLGSLGRMLSHSVKTFNKVQHKFDTHMCPIAKQLGETGISSKQFNESLSPIALKKIKKG